MSARRHGTRARGGKKVTKASKAAADKKKARVWFAGKSDPRPVVEAIMNEKDPKKRWQMEQALMMAEAVRIAKEDGERQARRAHELGLAHPGERIGAGELVDILHREQGR